MGGPTDVTMVVLGAGASHDCLRVRGHVKSVSSPVGSLESYPLDMVRPPLTKDLVAPTPFLNGVLQKYDRCVPLVSWLRRRLADNASTEPTTSLERALAEYAREADDNPEIQTHLLAFRFYLCEVLWRVTEYMKSVDLGGGDTNYQPLVRELYEWTRRTGREVCVVNFNYDLLFETACANYWGFALHNSSTYLEHPNVKVVKPHGSVNWQS